MTVQPTGGVPTLPDAISALDTVVRLGQGRLDADHVAAAERLRATVDERLARGEDTTVVAVAGGTGVGKSALVNRLVGQRVVDEGVRRPTTSVPVALLRPPLTAAAPLLDWLDIADRREAPPNVPAGLVLVDLPDHDSVVTSHRVTSARLASRVDALLVVVDPVKYARADLHHGPLAALTDHAEVVRVALNRVDELAPADVDRCLVDLRSRLTASGHAEVALTSTSAATGEGIDELRGWLDELARTRTAATRRLIADATALARRTLSEVPELPDLDGDARTLLDPVLEATDAHRAAIEAEVAYRRLARERTRSVVARGLAFALHRVTGVVLDLGLGSSSTAQTPNRTSVARIQAVLADELALGRTVGVTHAALGDTIGHLAARGAPELADAVDGAGLRPRRRAWWSVASAGRAITEATAAIGLLWLTVLAAADWLQLPEPPVPVLAGAVTWPTALAIGGLVLRLLLGLATRAAITRGAARHRAVVAARVRARLEETIRTRLLAPYEAELSRHRELRSALRVMAGC